MISCLSSPYGLVWMAPIFPAIASENTYEVLPIREAHASFGVQSFYTWSYTYEWPPAWPALAQALSEVELIHLHAHTLCWWPDRHAARAPWLPCGLWGGPALHRVLGPGPVGQRFGEGAEGLSGEQDTGTICSVVSWWLGRGCGLFISVPRLSQ